MRLHSKIKSCKLYVARTLDSLSLNNAILSILLIIPVASATTEMPLSGAQKRLFFLLCHHLHSYIHREVQLDLCI